MPRLMSLNVFVLVCALGSCMLSSDASASSSFSQSASHTGGPCRLPPSQCPIGNQQCEKDLMAFGALRDIYSHLDDNQDGKVDKAESHEFVLDELKYEDNGEWQARQSSLHGADNVMTLEELWCAWVSGEEHNWTQAEMADWLTEAVELPQYREAFERAALDGRMLPLLAAAASGSSSRFLSDTLGVRIALHRQKLSLKAIDLVLFGSPKRSGHALKDFALLVAVAVVLVCTGLVLHQRHYARQREAAMQRELEGLQRAEDAVVNMRKRLTDAEQFKQTVLQEKSLLELKLKMRERASKEQEEALRGRKTSIELYGANSHEIIGQLQDEVGQLSTSLRQAELQIDSMQFASAELQFWLQLTYEFELERFAVKKRMAESQFQQVRESCEKIRKRRNALFGSMRMAHGDILTVVDERIAEARKTLEEVIADASERTVRWSQIQRACGFDVVANPGLASLLAQERLRLANSNQSVNLLASSQTTSGSPISSSGSDTISMLSVRAPLSANTLSIYGGNSASNSNLAARRTGVEDGGLWLRANAASRRDDEECSSIRPRTADAAVISTESDSDVGDAPNVCLSSGCSPLTSHGHVATSLQLPRLPVANAHATASHVHLTHAVAFRHNQLQAASANAYQRVSFASTAHKHASNQFQFQFHPHSHALEGRFPRAKSHDSMHSLLVHDDVSSKAAFDFAEVAKMRNELDGLMLDAVVFAKPSHKKLQRNSTVHGLSILAEQHSSMSTASTNTNASDSLCNATDVNHAAHDQSNEVDNLKSFLFRWRTKTRLAQLRRRDVDKSATNSLAASTSQ